MYDLLKINGKAFPVPKGGFDIAYNDVTNDYSSEDGRTVVEIIREGVATVTVSYSGLTEETSASLKAALKTVNTVEYLKFGSPCTAQMKLSNLKTSKVYYKNGVSVWTLSFELKEL